MGIVIGLIGVVLGLLALPWLKGPIERLFFYIRRRTWLRRLEQGSGLGSVAAIRESTRTSVLEDFLIGEWLHNVKIGEAGNSKTSIDCKVVNLSSHVQEAITFPVYSDSVPDSLGGWAKIGRSSFELLPEYDNATGLGLFRICFPNPIKSRESLRIRWGYGWPSSYRTGSEYWEWYFARPHFLFKLTLEFDQSWRVEELRATIVKQDMPPPTPLRRGRTIHWRIEGPLTAHKYRLDFNLVRSSSVRPI